MQASGIPLGSVTSEVKSGRKKGKNSYNFILTKHKQRTIGTWRANPDLDRFLVNPVQQVCGPQSAAIPTTTELLDREKFTACADIFRQAAGRNYRSLAGHRGHLSDLIEPDCPVPIFKFHNNHRCPVSDKEALIEYFKNKFSSSREN